MTTPLIKDLQEIAFLSAQLLEGKDLAALNATEEKLVRKLTQQGYIIETSNSKGIVGEARRHRPPSKS